MHSGRPSDVPRLRVLIVEDESLISDYVEDVLEGTRFEVVGVARSVAEALQLAGRTGATLAVVDLLLEEASSGAEVARLLRERHGIAVVFITGSPVPDRGMEPPGGMAGPILRKPFLPGQLLNLLDHATAGCRP